MIPTICWGDEDSYEWCFDGEPVGGTVAVSSVGILNSKEKIKHFIMGYEEMIIREELVKVDKNVDRCLTLG